MFTKMACFLALTDVPWMLVSPNYLKNFRSREGILSWRNFLQKLGIHSRLAVRKFNEHVQEVSYPKNIKLPVCNNIAAV